jgi:hypothetical protein
MTRWIDRVAGVALLGATVFAAGCGQPSVNRSAAVSRSRASAGSVPVAVGAVAASIPSSPAEEALFRQAVADLSDASMEGRGPGTEGLNRARDYLVERFRSMGLDPGFQINGVASYTQPFTITTGVKVGQQTLELWDHRGEPLLSATPGEEFNALGFSADGEFEGLVVFAGYGIVDAQRGYDSYRGIDANALRGKVVVVFRYEPQDEKGRSLWTGGNGSAGPWSGSASLMSKARWAAERGAAALLVVNPPTQDVGDLKSTRYSYDQTTATIPVIHIQSGLLRAILQSAGRDPGVTTSESLRSANLGSGEVDFLEGVYLRGQVKIVVERATVANVAGLAPGGNAGAGEVIVVGAHYDHLGYGDPGRLGPGNVIYPGADDNASGAAGLLLLGKKACERRSGRAKSGSGAGHDAKSCGGDRRAVLLVAFSAEERGLLGSSYLVRHERDVAVTSPRVVAMLNMDMIGRMRDDQVLVLGVGSGDRWQAMLDAASAGTGLDIRQDPVAFGASDDFSFYNNKVPVLHFFTGTHADYHQPTDTVEKINPIGGVRVTHLIDRIIQKLADHNESIAFVPDAGGVHPRGMGSSAEGGPATAYLGVVPDYATLYGNDGCALSGVTPNSPAEAAGLRGGDVIVQWNETPVKNVYGLTEVLRASSPGQTVTIVVRRNGDSVELHATLGRR